MPSDHGEKLHDVPDEQLREVMVVAKKIAVAQGLVDYNILQVSTSSTAAAMHPHRGNHTFTRPLLYFIKSGCSLPPPSPEQRPHRIPGR